MEVDCCSFRWKIWVLFMRYSVCAHVKHGSCWPGQNRSTVKETLSCHFSHKPHERDWERIIMWGHGWMIIPLCRRYKTHQSGSAAHTHTHTHTHTHKPPTCQNTFTHFIRTTAGWARSDQNTSCEEWRTIQEEGRKEKGKDHAAYERVKLTSLSLPPSIPLSLPPSPSLSQEGWTPPPKPRLRSSSFQTM